MCTSPSRFQVRVELHWGGKKSLWSWTRLKPFLENWPFIWLSLNNIYLLYLFKPEIKVREDKAQGCGFCFRNLLAIKKTNTEHSYLSFNPNCHTCHTDAGLQMWWDGRKRLGFDCCRLAKPLNDCWENLEPCHLCHPAVYHFLLLTINSLITRKDNCNRLS